MLRLPACSNWQPCAACDIARATRGDVLAPPCSSQVQRPTMALPVPLADALIRLETLCIATQLVVSFSRQVERPTMALTAPLADALAFTKGRILNIQWTSCRLSHRWSGRRWRCRRHWPTRRQPPSITSIAMPCNNRCQQMFTFCHSLDTWSGRSWRCRRRCPTRWPSDISSIEMWILIERT